MPQIKYLPLDFSSFCVLFFFSLSLYFPLNFDRNPNAAVLLCGCVANLAPPHPVKIAFPQHAGHKTRAANVLKSSLKYGVKHPFVFGGPQYNYIPSRGEKCQADHRQNPTPEHCVCVFVCGSYLLVNNAYIGIPLINRMPACQNACSRIK